MYNKNVSYNYSLFYILNKIFANCEAAENENTPVQKNSIFFFLVFLNVVLKHNYSNVARTLYKRTDNTQMI